MRNQVKIIGVTGGIGAGKSEFSRISECIGAAVIDADVVARTMIEKSEDMRVALRKTFGDAIYSENGQLLRRELGRIVFSDPKELHKLNQITEAPLKFAVEDNIKRLVSSYSYIILDMAILFETGLNSLCDHVVLIKAEDKKRTEWIQKNKSWTVDEIQNRIYSQTPVQLLTDRADTIIVNDGDLASFHEKAKQFFLRFQSENPV